MARVISNAVPERQPWGLDRVVVAVGTGLSLAAAGGAAALLLQPLWERLA